MENILITGSRGFIGKNLAEALKGEYHLLCPGHAELDLLDAGATRRYLEAAKPDIVIHSAVQGTLGLPKEYERKVIENNLRMFYHLEHCRDCFGRMYYFGSGAEYGKETDLSSVSEHHFGRVVPSDDYGFSKYILSKGLAEDGAVYNLRLFGVFGPYENYNYRFISNCICKALQGRDIVIRRNARFDYLYSKDLCQIMHWFLKNQPRYRTYNVCTGHPIDILSIAQTIVRETGSSSRIEVVSEGLAPEYSGNNERLLSELGAFPFTERDVAIRELIHFYRTHDYELQGDY